MKDFFWEKKKKKKPKGLSRVFVKGAVVPKLFQEIY